LVKALIEVIVIVILDINIYNLYGIFKCLYMQEINVNYSILVDVPLAQEAGDVLEET